MSTNSKGVFSRCRTIWRATNNCASSPVPVSPMTAKVTIGLALFSPCAAAMIGSARSGSARISDLRRRIREVLIVIIVVCLLSLVFRRRLAPGTDGLSIDDVAPVHFKDDLEAAHGVGVASDQADLAPLIQLDSA